MKEKKWKEYGYADCPNCGAKLRVRTEEWDSPWVNDGDFVQCSNHCGFLSRMHVDEGVAKVKEGNLNKIAK